MSVLGGRWWARSSAEDKATEKGHKRRKGKPQIEENVSLRENDVTGL